MNDNFDDFVDNLQEEIFKETREAYGEAAYERWRNPRFQGAIADPDGHGRITGTCGDTMDIFLKFEGNRVIIASFLTDGCGSSGVCGSFAAELAHGKTPEELTDITGEMILDILGVFPEEEQHCAFLAAETVQAALSDYMQKQAGGSKI